MDSCVGLGLDEKDLFRSAMRGDYDRVQEIYKQHPAARKARITRSGDTALHMAVSNGKEQEVEQLVQLIKETEGARAVEALTIKNGRGNTPLHLAASLGNVRMCKCIAEIDPELIGSRNRDMETPFFLAAFYGRKDAFLCLHYLIPRENSGYSYSRRADGETILHCALSGEYFDLAFQIIHLYKNLVNSVNEKGFSPLHLLASNPTAFPSGSHISQFGKIIYHSIIVDKLEVQHHHPPLEEQKLIVVNCSESPDVENSQGQLKAQPIPPNYSTCWELIKLMSKAVLIVLSLGSREIVKIKEIKEKHTWAIQIMDELLDHTVEYEYEYEGRNPQYEAPLLKEGGTKPYEVMDGGDEVFKKQTVPKFSWTGQDDMKPEMEERESAILIAAKYGVAEMVKKILQLFPVAVHDMNSEKKNVVLLAVENRQPHVYKLLLDLKLEKDPIFREVDKDGNSALHLAARLGEYRPWLIPGAALQMQWEIKWYEFVKTSMPRQFFVRYNRYGKTPKEVFSETHKDLVKISGEWLKSTSQSCSVVATLIASVAFATSATVPGGVKQDIGTPTLENEPVFDVSAISSLIALCFSVTALVLFLSIDLTPRYKEKDFGTNLPKKLLWGLTSLLVSIVSMMISFCAGHYFVLKDKLKVSALPVRIIGSI